MPAITSIHTWLQRPKLSFSPRALWLCFVLPVIYFAAASLGFAHRHQRANRALTYIQLPLTQLPTAQTRLLVFAPHPDDETLGCAGLIQQTLKAGGAVRSVIITNGDSFRTAVECENHTLHVTAKDFIRFGIERADESRTAMVHLGLNSKDILFLGYPDQGLRTIWNRHWAPSSLYRSPTTLASHAPYPDLVTPNAPYCGQNLLLDIQKTIRGFQPTIITVTHPAEDHGDHATAAAFVALALRQLSTDPRTRHWAELVQLQFYLIHRGNWPKLPLREEAQIDPTPLLPPSEMMTTDSRWTTLPLSASEQQRKLETVEMYPSETSIAGHFLHSFLHPNELFATIPCRTGTVILQGIENHADRMNGDSSDWDGVPPLLVDPVRDNNIRELQGAGDIQSLYACYDSRNLYIRVDLREPPNPAFRYTVHIRPFSNEGQSTIESICLVLNPCHERSCKNGVEMASHDKSLEVAIPWKKLALSKREFVIERKSDINRRDALYTEQKNAEPKTPILGISAETYAGVEIDKTGIRLVEVRD